MHPFSPRIQGSPALYSAVLINPLPVPLLGQVTVGESVSFLVEFHEPDRLHATVQMFWNMMAPCSGAPNLLSSPMQASNIPMPLCCGGGWKPAYVPGQLRLRRPVFCFIHRLLDRQPQRQVTKQYISIFFLSLTHHILDPIQVVLQLASCLSSPR
ncbi:hypothetical protein Pelo_18552 [Pelomyxa schiedti]|nr:hypothetical protein Pelo_18552 [Pelomyxa schiedti]